MDKFIAKRAEIAKRILFLLEKKGWSQQKLADAVGVNKTYISDLLHLRHNPTLERIVELEIALGAKVLVTPAD